MTEPMIEENLDPLIPVKVIKTKGLSSLVEWDGPQRAFVPTIEIADGQVLASTLEECPPYGIVWENFIAFGEIEGLVCTQLKKAGIWTYEDLQNRDRILNRIATNIIGAEVWRAAKHATKGAKKGGK